MTLLNIDQLSRIIVMHKETVHFSSRLPSRLEHIWAPRIHEINALLTTAAKEYCRRAITRNQHGLPY